MHRVTAHSSDMQRSVEIGSNRPETRSSQAKGEVLGESSANKK